MPSEAYLHDLDVIRAATAKFTDAQKAYRLGIISDDVYLAARAEYAKAEKVFDSAYEVESR